MANRKDYYFRQKVTEAELDAGFEGLEVADRNLAVDHGLMGVAAGMAVSQKSGTPNLTVDVSGPGVAYSKAGERIAFSSLQNVNLALDDAAVSTAVAAPGNSRVVSLFVEFDRLLSDPRIDGNAITVFFQRSETFAFSVVAGAEATTGLESPPALDPNKILLADIVLDYAQTQILNADISVARREAVAALPGSPVSLLAGTLLGALEDLLAAFNDHLTGAANKHPAADVPYTGAGTWAGAITWIVGTSNVQAAISQIVSDLASQAANSGGMRIGAKALTATWADSVAVAAGSVWSQINQIVTDLRAAGGAGKIGSTAVGNIAATTVQAALAELDTDKLDKAGGSMSGNLMMYADYVYENTAGPSLGRARSVAIPLVPWVAGATWIPDDTNYGEWVGTGGANDPIYFDLLAHLPHGAEFESLSIVWEQTASFGATSDQIQASVQRHQLSFTGGARTVTSIGTASYGAGTGVKVNSTINPANFVIDKLTTALSDTALLLRLEQAAGGTSRILGVRMSFLDPGPRNI